MRASDCGLDEGIGRHDGMGDCEADCAREWTVLWRATTSSKLTIGRAWKLARSMVIGAAGSFSAMLASLSFASTLSLSFR
jgi:hypothetical protein